MATSEINKVIADGIKLLEKFNELLVEAGSNVSKVASDAEKLNSKIVNNSKSTKKGEDTQKSLNAAQKEAERINKSLLTTKVKIEAVESEQNKELTKQKQLLQERNKELKNTITLEDKQAGTLEKLAAQNRKLTNERKKLNLETEKGRSRLKAINTELDKNNTKLKDSNDALGKQRMNIGNYQSALDGLPGPLAGAVRGTQMFTKSLLVLLANPIVAIIVGIVAAFTALIAAFAKTEKGADAFNKIFAQISAVFDVIIGRVAKLADAVGLLLAGKFRAAGVAAKEAFTEIRKEINGAVKDAGAIEDLKISIFEDETEFIKSAALRRKQIQELIILTRDFTRSFEERRIALEKANKIELSLLSDEIDLQRQRVQLAKDELAATPANLRSREQKREIAMQEAALESAIAKSLSRQRELLNRVNELETKRLGEAKKVLDTQKAINAAARAQIEKEVSDDEKLFEEKTDRELELIQDKADRELEIEIEKNQKLLEEQEIQIEAREQLEAEADQRDRDLKLQTADALFAITRDRLNRQLQDENLTEEERKKIQKKAALLDVAQAIFGIGVSAAQNIFKVQAQAAVLAANPITAPLAGLALAQIPKIIAGAAINSAVIAALKIPGFASGVTNFGGGVAELAEQGSELVKESSGKVWMAENRGLYNLKQGSTVLTASQTQKELNDKNIVKGLGRVERAVNRMPRQRRESAFDARNKAFWNMYNSRRMN